MNPGALRALEFDRIVDAVAALAVTPPGQQRLAELRPLTDPAAVLALQKARGSWPTIPASRCAHRLTSTRSSTPSASRDARSSRCGCLGSLISSNRSSSRAQR